MYTYTYMYMYVMKSKIDCIIYMYVVSRTVLGGAMVQIINRTGWPVLRSALNYLATLIWRP